ncbi:DNA repair protein RecN [Coleofasciculus sp. FACHB-T130]|uniref:DNA repair protein RecN n=1 Tax=Cyanophyceae TaxID=3028117 RepID=UPI001686ABCA|nr:DNA repair protein RecN [Coleofasciculus sp. FACHB-T130]MBD1878031.1 DNA repair protein RecN [Coleofasciculus sp. FACHB-T130]
MLLSLRIENFALIDHLELEFGSGLNVLTGETGAGKSIILDAIDAALGGKVSKWSIRTGSDRALVEATFKVDRVVTEWLSEQEIELLDDTAVVCCREIACLQGSLRSRSRVNGVLVNRQLMDRLRDRLVEITAQGQTVQLVAPALQRELLDVYGGEAVLQQRSVVQAAYLDCQQARDRLDKRRQSEQQRLQRLDLLQYQAQELTAANLSEPDEPEQLEQERQRLSHVVELQQLSYQVYQALYQNDAGESAGADLLGQAEATLIDMVTYDATLQPVLDMVSTALAQVVEAGQQINAYGASLEADPQRLAEVEERIRTLKQICRKYGPTLGEAIAYSQSIQAELALLTDSGHSLEELEKFYSQCHEILISAADQLTALRGVAASELENRLVAELKPLAMEKVQFQVKIAPCPPTAAGADAIAFYFSPNPGEPLQPLSATASGGEMSRFLLALKACFSQLEAAGTLIFDEIDAGVSGRVAQAIAEKLHQLSQGHQVLCVTHQPLVAAMADRHFRVDKHVVEGSQKPDPSKKAGKKSEVSTTNAEAIHPTLPLERAIQGLREEDPTSYILQASERTVVRVSVLDNHQTRRQELATLAGGHSAKDAIAFAESLLAQAAVKHNGRKTKNNK